MSKKETKEIVTDNAPEISATKNTQTIGQILKESRTSQKITVDQVCSQLNLSSHVVKAIESDNYEGLPEITYIRGYIVSYCRLLGLDSFNILQQLSTQDQDLSVSNAITSQVSRPTRTNSSSLGKKFVSLVAIIAVILGAYLLYSNKDAFLSNQTEQVATDNSQNANQVSQSDQTDTNEATDQQAEPTEKTPVDENKIGLLELEFGSVSWVDIQNSKKERIVYKSFPRGEKHAVKAQLPLNIFIDNADGVFMRYEGRLIDLKPHIQDGYAKFTLSE